MYGIFIVLGILMVPLLSHASPCSDFQWHYPPEIVEPEVFQKAQQAMMHGEFSEARQHFLTFLGDQPEGALAEGAQYAMASLPFEEDEPDKKALNAIDRLTEQQRKNPQSPYAPWSLCRVGELYHEIGWSTEANGIFEEFLSTYSKHPLAGGVLLNTGLSFLEAKQYLEGALIFRRVVEEPKWERYHLEGALGLADATALSHAWDQANYWYQVVDVEKPKLIRASAASAYHYGLTKSKMGDTSRAIEWYLTTYNLHPQKIEAGYALNNVGNYLLKNHHEMMALWFFQEAALRYKSEEPGRRGEAALTRWVFSYLASEHSKDEWRVLYDRFDALEIYLLVSWDGVIESARALAQSPETDVADEAQFWLGKGYQEIGDTASAMDAYSQLALSGEHEPWKKNAQNILNAMLLDEFRTYYQRRQWVELLRFYEKQQWLLSLLQKNPEWMHMLAEAYRHIGLSRQAMKWYDEILRHGPDDNLKEEILFNLVALAYESGDGKETRQAAKTYVQAYRTGKWKEDISLILGKVDITEQHLKSSLKHFSEVVEHGHENKNKQNARAERARVYYALEQYDLAIKDYRHLVESHVATLGIRLSLADLLYEQKRYKEAEIFYQPIAESESVVEAKTWAQFRLALCFQQTGKLAAATELLSGLRQPGQDLKDLEGTIRAAAAAVIDEFIPTKKAS